MGEFVMSNNGGEKQINWLKIQFWSEGYSIVRGVVVLQRM